MGTLLSKAMPACRAFAHAPEHEIVANLAAAADAAVAQDARVEIHGDAQRGIILGRAASRVAQSAARDLLLLGERFELAIAGMLLARAGLGWSDISISTSVRRARCTFSDCGVHHHAVSAGRTQDAVNTRAPTSTTHTRQTPTGVSFC